jgi:UDP:flavonoid glycosyltransferase YjiC (YdhE family)
MSRILLTWELGLNLGHLTRLLPVAEQLKADGHTVLVASRDIQAAATVLGPAGIPFVQAPHLPKGIALAHRATGYADILLSQGWSDASVLWGLTQAWLNLIRMFRPDQLILDYSPTVSLAGRIAKIPTVLIGNGFELPPTTDPLPPFPGFSWATVEKAAESEHVAVANANGALSAFGGARIAALRDLMIDHPRLLATFPELDHYGERTDSQYIGPLLGRLNSARIDWPDGEGPRIFACVRPDTSHVNDIIRALAAITARVVCVAIGFTAAQLEPFRKASVRFALEPVALDALSDADLCITYGAEGTIMKFLMAGVPQLISPWHVETYMAARKIKESRLGGSYEESAKRSLVEMIATLTRDETMSAHLRAFANGAARLHAMQSDVLKALGRGADSGRLETNEIDVVTIPIQAREVGNAAGLIAR